MTLCRLCGYQTRILDAADPYCPVCGNKYASRGGNDDAAQASPQVPQESTSFDGADPSGTRSPECLDPELQALLQLLPRKLDKERKQEDVIRAACKLNPGQSATHDNKFGEVYIRRRADPTMSALKVGSSWGAAMPGMGLNCFSRYRKQRINNTNIPRIAILTIHPAERPSGSLVSII